MPSGVRPYVFLGLSRSSAAGSEPTVLTSPLAETDAAAGPSAGAWRWRSWPCCSRVASGAELMVWWGWNWAARGRLRMQQLRIDEAIEERKEEERKVRRGEVRRAGKKEEKKIRGRETPGLACVLVVRKRREQA